MTSTLARRKSRPRWITQEDAAEELSVTVRTIRNMIARGDLPAYRLGKRSVRLDANDVEALLRRIPTTDGAA